MTGLDFQMSMLSRAAAKARDAGVEIEWVRADMRRFHLNARFATVILPFNGLCLVHTTSDAERLLGCVRDHLEPRGRFVLDVTNPRLAPLADCAPADTSVAKYQFEDPGGTGVVGATHHARYDRVSQILDVELEYALPDGKTTRDRLRMRMYFPQELRALLQYNGFRVVKAFGDYDESRLESSSERQLLVCELR